MKKILSLLLSVFILCTCMLTPAAATEINPNEQIAVETARGSFTARAINEEQDLGSDGYVVLKVEDVEPNQVRISQYTYRTNSTKLVVKIKGDYDVAIRIRLYNAATETQFSVKTVNISSSYSYVTFEPLTYADTYYFKFENLSQQKVTLSGTISAS